MTNVNISIKQEAYGFLKSFKERDKSFSDVILEFKNKGVNQDIMRFFGALKDEKIDWKAREKSTKEFRDNFNKRMNKKLR